MNEHSPGPWLLVDSRRIVDAEGQSVCEPLLQKDGQAVLYFPNGGPDGLDAALLVTAPGLLIAAADAAGAVKGAAEILRTLGHPKTAAKLETALVPLMAAMVKASKGTLP